MWGAIAGDIIGSRFEFNNHRSKDFELFKLGSYCTDDSIMSVAVAETLLDHDKIDDREFTKDLIATFKMYGKLYPYGGYGSMFGNWIRSSDPKPYLSFGNGSAMRVSSVGWYATSLAQAEHIAKLTAAVTHNHPHGIIGAVVTAGSIYLARTGGSKNDVLDYFRSFGYVFDTSVDVLRETNKFNETCQITMPVVARCFMESTDFEDAIRNAICVGGDSDTIAAITGSIAEAFYGLPEKIKTAVQIFTPPKMLGVLTAFDKKYIAPKIKKSTKTEI